MDLIWKLLHLSLQLQRFLKQIPLKFKISSKLQDNNQFGLRNECQPEGMPIRQSKSSKILKTEYKEFSLLIRSTIH